MRKRVLSFALWRDADGKFRSAADLYLSWAAAMMRLVAAKRVIMHHSHVIEVSGQFAGAAVSHEGRFRFVAVDPRVEELDDSLWPSLPDVQRVVTHLLTTGRLPAAQAPST